MSGAWRVVVLLVVDAGLHVVIIGENGSKYAYL